MPDPHEIQHDKKVMNDKKHRGEDLKDGAAHAPQPGKKTPAAEKPADNATGEHGHAHGQESQGHKH